MASIVETKAVALRRGSHSENLAFTGVQGEVTVDLGEKNLGTDVNTTLRLHNGTTTGGIPMARADMLNVSTQVLAENRAIVDDKNLAYADLSNIEVTNNSTEKEKIVSILGSYGLATKSELSNKVDIDTGNLNTKYLTEETIHDGRDGNLPLAYANTSNINTADLVNGSLHPYSSTNGNKPLSYADLSNVNTTNITLSEAERTAEDVQVTGPVIAKADFSNTNTTLLADTLNRPQGMSGPVLATADLSNVDSGIIKGILASEIATMDDVFATTDLTNISNWDMLYKPSSEVTYFQNVTITDAGDGFQAGENYPTGIYLKDDTKHELLVEITSVDSLGTVTGMTINDNVGTIDLTNENPFIITSETDANAIFTITSTDNQNGTYTYNIATIIDGGSGFHEEESSIYTGIYVVKLQSTDETLPIVCDQLYLTPTAVEEGGIIEAVTYPQYTRTNINENATIPSDFGSSYNAMVHIQSSLYGTAAGVAKVDLTNLTGMSLDDQENERNANWRIRHNENIPALTNITIPDEQNYTIATNGAVWRILKPVFNTPNVTLKTKFIPNNDHSTLPTLTVIDKSNADDLIISEYAKNTSGECTTYMIFPARDYEVTVSENSIEDTHIINESQLGALYNFNYSLAIITFNLNVQQATLEFTTEAEGVYKTVNVNNGTYTGLFIKNVEWTAEAEGYNEQTGTIDISDGDQTITVTF